MKTTYLIYKQINGFRQLAVASQQEWDAILKENRQLPPAQRRCFMKDCIADGAELDCMYIEVSAEEHRKWNSNNTVRQRNRKAGMQYGKISLDTNASDADTDSLYECISTAFDLEQLVSDHVLMDELQEALRKLGPWTEELLKLYLTGEKHSCTKKLCDKYEFNIRTAQRRKSAFEKFILDFLKK